MAPKPGDPHLFEYDDSDWPPPGVTPAIPAVTTSTYSLDPRYPSTVAYLINSWVDDEGDSHTYTMSTFSDLGDASTMAYKLAQALQSAQQGSIPTGAVQSQYSAYGGSYGSHSASPAATGSSAAQTSSVTDGPQNQEPQKGHHGPSVTTLAVGIIVPIVVCLLTITACVFCVSHYRRKARRAQAEGLAGRMSSEMREVGSGGAKPTRAAIAADERAYLAPPGDLPQPTTAMTATTTASGALGQEPPVILSTTMNNTYFTGIDTSDQISLSDQRSMASHDTFGEEPPPPYRPRSVPPISRETSVRTSIMSTPHRNPSTRSRCETLSSGSMIRRSNEVRSPFDDPEEEEEDDNISEVSTIRGDARGATDRLSEVSDLSYQEDPRPTASHSHV